MQLVVEKQMSLEVVLANVTHHSDDSAIFDFPPFGLNGLSGPTDKVAAGAPQRRNWPMSCPMDRVGRTSAKADLGPAGQLGRQCVGELPFEGTAR